MMPPDIELRYIHIKWNDDRTVKSIEESQISSKAEVTGTIHHFDLYAYTRDGAVEKLLQPAFSIKNIAKLAPYILKVDGEKVQLREVCDPESKKTWWIEDGKWKQHGRAWHGFESQWLNSAGEVDVVIGNIQCHLTIRTVAIEDWQIIYDEFKNELYNLVFKEGSSVRAAVARSGVSLFDERLGDILGRYLNHLGKILRKPQKILREIQSKKSIAKLKPVTKTFVEFSMNPTLKKYTGKDTEESLDTADNRYIHYTLLFFERIIKWMQVSQLVTQKFWEQKRDNNQQQLDSLSDCIQVDKALFLKEIKIYEEEYEKFESSINKSIEFQADEYISSKLYSFEINVFAEYNQSNDTWPCFVIVDGVQRGVKSKKGTIWCPLRFEKCFNSLIKTHQERRYKICAHAVKRGGQTFLNVPYEKREEAKARGAKWDQQEKKWYAPGGVPLAPLNKWLPESLFYIVEIHNITEMIPLSLKGKLVEWRKKRIELERNEWQYHIDKKQKIEQENHKNILQSRYMQFADTLQKINAQKEYLPVFQKKLTQISYIFSKLCKPTSTFPASMAFIQNPDYYGAHLCYNELRNLAGLDGSTLNALEQLDHIGVVDIPTVYERWCLLQVIKIVTEVFGFTSEEGWEQRLIAQIVDGIKMGGHKNVRDIKLEFEHAKTGWRLEVWYEKPLPNGKRPDITLNLLTKDSKNELDTYTLILDAKYYEQWGSITGALENLYLEKDYGMTGRNYVFVLHPCGEDMPEKIRTSPQIWGKHNFYGENQMFTWEKNKIKRRGNDLSHKYGFIMLSPATRNGNDIDNLQRLIGMFLQYPFYKDHDKKELEHKKYFCISCGANSYKYDPKETEGGHLKYPLVCEICGHNALLTHCFSKNCGTPIFKNGPYWSYHKAELLEPFNFSCPDCGSRF